MAVKALLGTVAVPPGGGTATVGCPWLGCVRPGGHGGACTVGRCVCGEHITERDVQVGENGEFVQGGVHVLAHHTCAMALGLPMA